LQSIYTVVFAAIVVAECIDVPARPSVNVYAVADVLVTAIFVMIVVVAVGTV
jgi:hypothetical protein